VGIGRVGLCEVQCLRREIFFHDDSWPTPDCIVFAFPGDFG
jgi:hypothetical protein